MQESSIDGEDSGTNDDEADRTEEHGGTEADKINEGLGGYFRTTECHIAANAHCSSTEVFFSLSCFPLESSTGTLGSLEHSLDSDSELEEEGGRTEEQPLSPINTEDPEDTHPTADVQNHSGSDNEPPALPESEPPELESPDELPTSSFAQLSINQSNNNEP